MNPGYLALILVSCSAILIASGWKDFFLKDISNRAIFLFFLGWILGANHSWTLQDRFEVYGFALVLLWLVIYTLFRMPDWVDRFHFFCFGLFLGSLYYITVEFIRTSPIYTVFGPKADSVLIMTLAASLMRMNSLRQILVLTVGLSTGTILDQVSVDVDSPITLADPSYQDQWWLAVCAVQLLALVRSAFFRAVRIMAERWLKRD